MLSTSILLGVCLGLCCLWLGLSLWVVAGRLLYDRRVRLAAEAARDLLAADGSGERPALPRRRLRRVAAGDQGAAAVVAARHLVALDERALVRTARRVRTPVARVQALRILARGGSPAAVGLLREAIAEAKPKLTAAVLPVAAELQTPAADALLLEVLVGEAQPRSRTATQLEQRAHRLRDELLALGEAGDPALRYWAMTLLGRLGADRDVATLAVRLTWDRDASVRAAAAEALAGVAPRRRTRPLRRLLRDDAFYVRAHAARAVGAAGATTLARDVAALLADTSWWVRAAAKESLLELGAAGLAAASEMLAHEDAFARDGALEVVVAPGRPAALLAAAAAVDVVSSRAAGAVA